MNFNLYDIVETKGAVGVKGMKGIIVQLHSPLIYGTGNKYIFYNDFRKNLGDHFAIYKTDYAVLALSKAQRVVTFEQYCKSRGVEVSEVYRGIYEQDSEMTWTPVHPTFDLKYISSISKEEYHNLIFTEEFYPRSDEDIIQSIERIFSEQT